MFFLLFNYHELEPTNALAHPHPHILRTSTLQSPALMILSSNFGRETLLTANHCVAFSVAKFRSEFVKRCHSMDGRVDYDTDKMVCLSSFGRTSAF